MKKIAIPLFLLLIIGCSREPLDGTIYMVRGDGDITRGAALDVHILDFDSVLELQTAFIETEKELNNISLNHYIKNTCTTFSSAKKNKLQTKRDNLSIYSHQCIQEDKLANQLQHPDKIEAKIIKEKEKLSQLVLEKISTMKAESASMIKISYEYNEYNEWIIVTVENNSLLGLDVSNTLLGGFTGGKLINSCNQRGTRGAKNFIESGQKQSFSMGSCFSTGDIPNNRSALIKSGKRLCVKAEKRASELFNQLCIEDFGPIKNGTEERGDWVFTSDFLIEQEIVNHDTLVNLQSELEAFEKAQYEKTHCKEINQDFSTIESLSCPASGSNRYIVTNFYSEAKYSEIHIEPPPEKIKAELKNIVEKNVIASTTTDVNGVFSFKAPPDKIFFIYTNYQDNFVNAEWVLQVNPEDTSIELNNKNAFKIANLKSFN